MRGQDITGANEAARNNILAEQAKKRQFHQPIAVSGGEVADPNDPMGQRKLRLPNSIYDPNTGDWKTQPQQKGNAGGVPGYDTYAAQMKAKHGNKVTDDQLKKEYAKQFGA